MNSVTLIGRLTADPDLRFINTGTAISKFTIAIDRSYRKDNQAVTDFIPVEIWGKKAEYCATYIEKGCLVAISGSLHIDRFIDSTGNNRNYAKVVANSIMKLNTPNKNNGGNEINSSETAVTNSGGDITNNQTSSSTNSSTTSNNPTNNSELSDDPTSNLTACTDDDLPF
nr:single-stranded DNA-binding protein [uncultured Intestinibacter sp.]